MTNLRHMLFHRCGDYSRRTWVAAIVGSAVVSLAIQGAVRFAFG